MPANADSRTTARSSGRGLDTGIAALGDVDGIGVAERLLEAQRRGAVRTGPAEAARAHCRREPTVVGSSKRAARRQVVDRCRRPRLGVDDARRRRPRRAGGCASQQRSSHSRARQPPTTTMTASDDADDRDEQAEQGEHDRGDEQPERHAGSRCSRSTQPVGQRARRAGRRRPGSPRSPGRSAGWRAPSSAARRRPRRR